MKRSRFSEKQIIAMLKAQEAGMATVMCRRHGIGSAMFYKMQNGLVRGERLSETPFAPLPHARFEPDASRHGYNHVRPHSNWAGEPPPRKPANLSGGKRPDRLPSPQPTILKEPDSMSDW